MTRRKFLKSAACAGIGTQLARSAVLVVPSATAIGNYRSAREGGRLLLRPFYVQHGAGPHLLDWAYASDAQGDAFHCNMTASRDGVAISDAQGHDTFDINVRWNVEGFGYTFLTADNGGDHYHIPGAGQVETLNLNFELARSRVVRNGKRLRQFERDGWSPSRETQSFHDLSSELLGDAERRGADERRRAVLAQKALCYALWGSEMMELENANDRIRRLGRRNRFYFGCDGRSIAQMDQNRFLDLFAPLFSFAMVTYFVGSHDFNVDPEATEGALDLATRDAAVQAFRNRGIAVEGRSLFWFHTWVTPEWLKEKTFDGLKKYIERHTREVIAHYPDDTFYAWEVMNEFHDWANEVGCSPDQTVELTKLACDVARDANPRVKLAINNCCPFAEYVALGQYSSGCVTEHPQRTPWQYTRDCIDAGVDFDFIGQQLYFPYRDLQDTIISLERLESLHKPVQISEIGCPGGPTTDTVKIGKYTWPQEPYAWHRPWDEELAADWAESIFTLAFSKPWVEGACWFDFTDPYSTSENGGLLRSPDGGKKAAYLRIASMVERLKNLPGHAD